MLESVQLIYELYPLGGASISLVFGLLIGSFLNVVVGRLPVMLEHAWRQEASEFLALEPASSGDATLSLVTPRSRCPNCKAPISAADNIPIISYLLLKGRCRTCKTNISVQYPLVELTAGLATVFLIHHLGLNGTGGLACLFTYALISLAIIDYQTTLLPDQITLPFVWIGLIANLSGTFTSIEAAVIGAIAGYLSLWSVYWLFRLITGKEGMGFGDFKLLAMLGAWLGWQALPSIILLSSLAGTIIGLCLIAFGRDRNHAIPFGPYLVLAGWIALIWGNEINESYFKLLGVL